MTALARHEPRAASFDEMRAFAHVAVKSRFYGFKSEDEMLPLMLIAQSQGRSFTSVVEEYSVINGRPALKSESMLARFQKAGGHIQWTELSDKRCAAIFSHPQCSPVEVDWDLERAKAAGLSGRDMWRKFPRNMLKARVISDGVRTAYPACLGGVYTPEELGDMEPAASVSRPAVAPSPQPLAVEVEHTEAGAGDSTPTAPASSSATIEHDGEEVDQTTQPEWPVLESEMEAFSTREDLKAWWTTPEKKSLKARKPHLMRAFYRFAYTPRWEELGETVAWEDAGERG